MYISNSQEPTGVPPIVFDYIVMGQSRALTLLKLCVMVVDYNLVAESHRSTMLQPIVESRENLRTGIFGIVFFSLQ